MYSKSLKLVTQKVTQICENVRKLKQQYNKKLEKYLRGIQDVEQALAARDSEQLQQQESLHDQKASTSDNQAFVSKLKVFVFIDR